MALSFKSGTFTGDGNDNRTVTGLGFQPTVLFIREIVQTAGDDGGAMRFSSMGAGNSYSIGANSDALTTAIKSLDADGFTLGTSARVNASTVVYYYLALAGTDVYVSSYAGTGIDQTITGVGFQPLFMAVHGGLNAHGISKYASSGTGTDSSQYFTNLANVANKIESLNSDGFAVGTGAEVNTNAITYYYFCVKAGSTVVNGQYTGNGADARSLTGLGITPTALIIKSATTNSAAFRTEGMAGDSSATMDVAGGANMIQEMEADGFEVGTDGRVNTDTVVYHYVAFGTVSAAGPANLKSYNTNLKANIKSIDTNLIANVKSLDTNV